MLEPGTQTRSKGAGMKAGFFFWLQSFWLHGG